MESVISRRRYRIRVGCHLEEQRMKRLGGVSTWVVEGDAMALDTVPLDQSALHGLVGQIRDLNIVLISIERRASGRNE